MGLGSRVVGALCLFLGAACGGDPGEEAEGGGTAMSETVASSPSNGTVAGAPVSGPWKVADGFIRAADGRAVIPRGVNLSGQHKLPPYFGFHQAPDFARVRNDWGMNSIRFVMTWAAIEPQKGVYDDAYLDKVAERMAWAKAANLLVILDMHQDVWGEGFAAGGGDGAPVWTCPLTTYQSFEPSRIVWTLNYTSSEVQSCYDAFWGNDPELQAHYAEAWRRVATKLARFDNILGFDIMNEPFWGTHTIRNFEHDHLLPFYERIVPVVRAAAPGWLAFVEPSTARNAVSVTTLPRPSFSNIVYAPHSYDVLAETGLGFGTSRVNGIIDNIKDLRKEASSIGAALWIGEYGGKSTMSNIAAYMNADEDGIAMAAAGSAVWSYSTGDYGLLDKEGKEHADYVNSVVRPTPEVVAGTPIEWRFDPATKGFAIEYRADRSIGAPTVLSVPSRVYPNGVRVECGDCVTEKVGDEVIIKAPPSGEPALVVLHP